MALVFLELITADIAVYVNCESRLGYKYCLVFTDVATKYFWEFPLKERSGKEVLRCVKELLWKCNLRSFQEPAHGLNTILMGVRN